MDLECQTPFIFSYEVRGSGVKGSAMRWLQV